MKKVLYMHCCECGAGIEVPTGLLYLDGVTKFVANEKWIVSIVSPPGESPVKMALVCAACSQRTHSPEALTAAHEMLSSKNRVLEDESELDAVWDDDKDRIAKAIDQVTEIVSPALLQRDRHEIGLPTAMALCLFAAHEALHDGQDEHEFLKVARAAWKRSTDLHKEGCS